MGLNINVPFIAGSLSETSDPQNPSVFALYGCSILKHPGKLPFVKDKHFGQFVLHAKNGDIIKTPTGRWAQIHLP